MFNNARTFMNGHSLMSIIIFSSFSKKKTFFLLLKGSFNSFNYMKKMGKKVATFSNFVVLLIKKIYIIAIFSICIKSKCMFNNAHT